MNNLYSKEDHLLLIELFSNLPTFNNFDDIKTAVNLDINVHWKNEGYLVIAHSNKKYLILFKYNNSCVGLFHLNDIDSDYSPKDFFSKSLHLTKQTGNKIMKRYTKNIDK